MSELRPCPFCGKSVATVESFTLMSLRRFCVECIADAGGCGSSGGYAPTAEEAIERWNSSVNREACTSEREAVKRLEGAISIISDELNDFDENSIVKIALNVGRIQELLGDIQGVE